MLGGRKIILTGIDLCFVDGASHVKGTKVEFDLNKSKPLWTKVENNSGEMVDTIPVWRRCHEEYVNATIKYANKGTKQEVLNTSLVGVHIHGTKLVGWDELESLFKSPSFAIKKIRKHMSDSTREDLVKFGDNKTHALKRLRELDNDLKELFNTLDDFYENNAREEQKIIAQLRTIYDPMEFFRTVENFKMALKTLYTNPCKPIDAFKSRWYLDKDFSNLILDTVQLDTFKSENRTNSLRNHVKMDFERLKMYGSIHMQLFRVIKFYVGQMILIMEGNPVSKYPPMMDIDLVREKAEETIDFIKEFEKEEQALAVLQ